MPATEPMFGMTYPVDLDPLADWPAIMQGMVDRIAATMQGRVVNPDVANLQAEVAARAAADTALSNRVTTLENRVDGPWTDVSYLTGWSTVAGFRGGQYRLLRDGNTVEMRGLCTGPNGPSDMFTLPVGYRLGAAEVLSPQNDAAFGRVTVFPTGIVSRTNGSGYVSLSGLQFSTL